MDAMREPGQVLSELRRAASGGMGAVVDQLCSELDMCMTTNWDSVPDAFLSDICSLFGDESFLKVGESWKLAHVVNQQWDLLSGQQRVAIFDVFVNAFDRFADWMGAFVVSEIIGGRYASESGLAALERLARTVSVPHRRLVPHGIEWLGRATDSQVLRGKASDALRRLILDPDLEVRREASLSLAKLDTAG